MLLSLFLNYINIYNSKMNKAELAGWVSLGLFDRICLNYGSSIIPIVFSDIFKTQLKPYTWVLSQLLQ